MKTKFTMPDGEIIEKDFPQWKTPYNHDRDFESERTALYCNDPSLTKQEFKEETDINVILKRFTRTGELPPMPVPEDFIDITARANYFEMQQRIANANAIFYQLDPEIRAQHLNSPAKWADQVVAAVAAGDGDRLNELGVAIEDRKAAKPLTETPPATKSPEGGTPAPSGDKGPPSDPKKAPSGAKD